MRNLNRNEALGVLENLGLNATEELVRGIQSITWNINEEDIPLAIEGFINLNLDFFNLRRITYDTGEFTEWLEKDGKYDAAFEANSFDGTLYFVWSSETGVLKQVRKKVVFK